MQRHLEVNSAQATKRTRLSARALSHDTAISYRDYCLGPGTDKIQYATRHREGFFVLGDPKCGNEKHYARNQVYVDSEDKMIERIYQDFPFVF